MLWPTLRWRGTKERTACLARQQSEHCSDHKQLSKRPGAQLPASASMRGRALQPQRAQTLLHCQPVQTTTEAHLPLSSLLGHGDAGMAALRQAPTADKRGARTSSGQAGTAVCLPSCATVGSSQGLPSLGPQVAHSPVLSFRWPLTCMTELMATSTAQYSAWPRASWFQMRTMAMQRASPTRMTPAAGCCCQCRLQWGMGLKMMHMLAWKRCQHKAAERNVSRQQDWA